MLTTPAHRFGMIRNPHTALRGEGQRACADTRYALSNILGLRTSYEALSSSAKLVRRRIRVLTSVRKSPEMSAISDSDWAAASR